MQEFFNKEIRKSDAKEVLSMTQLMFKDVKSSRLKRYFTETLTKHVRQFSKIRKYRKYWIKIT